MNRIASILLPAALLSSAAMAETVSPEQALDKALSFYRHPAHARSQMASSGRSLTLAHTAQADGETYFYAFNNPAGGYVIVGGDDVARDVLAYSPSGTFRYDQLCPAMRWWLGQYQSQIHAAIVAERQGRTARRASTRAAESWAEIQPLLGNNEWHQAPPFNALIPGNDMTEMVIMQKMAGCVATAVAQVMHYWKYPERGMGRHAYSQDGQLLEADFAASTYQWNLMQEEYAPAYNATPEEDAVARLLSDVGIALNMQYGDALSAGSTTSEQTIPYALRTYFGYSKDMRILYRDQMEGLADGEWEKIVYGELAEGRPVIYSGGNPNYAVGHTFVCDGYKDGFFHINWGMVGMPNDAYYLLTSTDDTPALTPTTELEGIGTIVVGQYDCRHSIITGVEPDPQSEGYVYHVEPMVIPAEAPLHGTLHLEGKFHNPTSRDVEAMVAAIIIDDDHYFPEESEPYTTYQTVHFPAKQEVVVSFDIPTDSLIPGVNYLELFEITDVTAQEITKEDFLATTWLFYRGYTHVEGPDYAWLNLSEGAVTLCLPFSTALPDGVRAYTAESITADNRVVMKPASSIEAGICYLVTSDERPQEPFLLSGMKTTDETWSAGPVLRGNLSSEAQLYESACFVLDEVDGEDVFTRRNATYVFPQKGFIDGSLSDAEFLHIQFDDATGIQLLGEQSWGNLRFTPLGQPQREARGLIVEGRRVVFVK